MAAPRPPPLTPEQTAKVLLKLADLDDPIVLVGGQALNFWANFYAGRCADLQARAPFTSQDIDFFGSPRAVKQCADRLGGTARLSTFDDMNTPNSGVVVFVDDQQHVRTIDFLSSVYGLDGVESIPATLLGNNQEPIATFSVLDPLLCLRSRASNVAGLPGYQSAHALNQLYAALSCVREYARDLLAAGLVKKANQVNSAVFKLARYGAGVQVFVEHGIDVLDALLLDEGLPPKFFTHRLPNATAAVERARCKAMAAKAHREVPAPPR